MIQVHELRRIIPPQLLAGFNVVGWKCRHSVVVSAPGSLPQKRREHVTEAKRRGALLPRLFSREIHVAGRGGGGGGGGESRALQPDPTSTVRTTCIILTTCTAQILSSAPFSFTLLTATQLS